MAKPRITGKSEVGKTEPIRVGARSLAQLVPRLTRSLYKRRSPAGAALMADWSAAVGPALAARTEPRRLSGTTLTLACDGPTALELQHAEAALAARINGWAGRITVERIRFVQAPVTAASPRAPQRIVAPVPIPDLPPGELADALSRLGGAIRDRSR